MQKVLYVITILKLISEKKRIHRFVAIHKQTENSLIQFTVFKHVLIDTKLREYINM